MAQAAGAWISATPFDAAQAHGSAELTFKWLNQFDGSIEMHVQYIGTCGNLKDHIRGGFDTNEVPEPVGLDGGHLSQTERGIGGHDRQVLQQGGLREGGQSLQRFDGVLVADGKGARSALKRDSRATRST